MHTNQDPAARTLSELNALTYDLIVMAAMRGDAYRQLKRAGHLEEALRNIGANQIEAQLLISLAEKLEELIRGGREFVQALAWLRQAGWINRITHHTTLNLEP